jgi:hypothetical protein
MGNQASAGAHPQAMAGFVLGWLRKNVQLTIAGKYINGFIVAV